MNPLHNAVLCILVLLTPRLQLTLVDTKQKIKTYHDCISYSFLFEGCCFAIFLCFLKHIKFDKNFVTKKPKQKIETWLVSIYSNKCLQNFFCQMKRQGSGSLKCFKTKVSRHSKIKYTYIIYIIISFINSETTALLHLTSLTEDVTNIDFHIPIWEIFSGFLSFFNLFHESLSEWNNSKIWETRKIFANIAPGNVR